MKKLLIIPAIIISLTVANGQTKQTTQQKSTAKKTTHPQTQKKSADDLDTSPKKYVTTTTSFEETDPTKPYGKATANFTFSDNYVIITISGIKKVYKIESESINEWGTTVYITTDKEGNYCEWKNGKTNYGDPFVQYKGYDGTKITYSNTFR